MVHCSCLFLATTLVSWPHTTLGSIEISVRHIELLRNNMVVTRLTILVCWYIAIRHITTELLSKCLCPDKNPVLCPKFLRCIACGSFSVLFPRTVSVYCIHESRLKSTGSRVGKPRKDCFSAFALPCGFGAFLRHYFGAFTVAEYIQFSKSFDILL